MCGYSLKTTVLAVQGQQQPRMQHLSPEGVAHLSQNKLLPLLLQRALAANESNSIRLGHAVDSVQQGQQGVSCSVASAEVSMRAARGQHHVPRHKLTCAAISAHHCPLYSAEVQTHATAFSST